MLARWSALGPVTRSRVIERLKRDGPRASVVSALIAAARWASANQRDHRMRESSRARGARPPEVKLARLALSASPPPRAKLKTVWFRDTRGALEAIGYWVAVRPSGRL